MPENNGFVQCYNRGCGQHFDPNKNDKDECCHHPGAPIFHDAYKGWSCCNKKSVDFTEFLNIKGCTLAKHSNVKPPEPEKKALDKELASKEVIEVRAPVVGPQLPRPPFNSPMVTLEPTIAESLKQSTQNLSQQPAVADDGNVAIGTTCKNGGCNISYEGPHTNDTMCTYHPGCPVFHEGLKFWSCCQKRTTDFNTFLSQPGCTTGTHKWTKEATPAGTVKCRWDWHQTPDYVIVSVYAKKYDPTKSFVKVNPIRLNTKLVFREQGDAAFELDLELRGKPPEPEKKALDKELASKEVIEVRAPVVGPQLPRPPFNSPMVTLEPTIAESLKQSTQNLSQQPAVADDGNVAIGTTCKNGGCNISYEGPHTNDTMCTYHPGCPVFHEGLKFWSCCQKRTTDFNTFLSQPGCTTGTHKWTKEATPAGTVKCRWDWHQTPDYVIVSVYAKKYDPTKSFVKVNPIRLNTKLVFREQGDAAFELDLELRGVINIEKSNASMLSTKIEIKLKKGEPGAWSKLDFPHTKVQKDDTKPQDVKPSDDDYEDLSSVEAIQSIANVNVTG